MNNLKRYLLKILLLTAMLAIFLTSTVEAKKSKKHTRTNISRIHHQDHTENHHAKMKRSTYSKNWDNYGQYNLPPYLVYSKKLGAYYPYFKYPENHLRRNIKNSSKQTASNHYSTLRRNFGQRNVK